MICSLGTIIGALGFVAMLIGISWIAITGAMSKSFSKVEDHPDTALIIGGILTGYGAGILF